MAIELKRIDQKFVAVSDYSDYEDYGPEHFPPKVHKFRWDPEKKYWWTKNIETAKKLAEFADEDVAEYFVLDDDARKITLSQSRAVEVGAARLDGLLAPAGKKYLPYQEAGILFLGQRPAVLLGDEMGLGKTVQAIGLINALPIDDAQKILIVCPASLKINWRKELDRWLTRKMTVQILGGKHKKNTPPPKIGDAHISIINYDIVKKHRAELDIRWDLIVIDEAHFLKNDRSQRTQALFGGKRGGLAPIRAKRKILLTGTPIVNRPAELWPLLHYLDPDTWDSWWQFVHKYCNAHRTRFGLDYSGASNLEELQTNLRSTLLLRRLKKDVLNELPAKRRQILELPQEGSSRQVKKEAAAWEDHEKLLQELDAVLDAEQAKHLRAKKQVAFEELSKCRLDTARAKLPQVIDYLTDLADSVEKIVVFVHHQEIAAGLMDAFGGRAVEATGRVAVEDRQRAVENFQENSECQFFVGSIHAAGTGLTLTAAAHVVFAELDWVPANLSQAEDRCHRLGQKKSVSIQHLVIQDSLDARMAELVIEKQNIADAALDAENEKQEKQEKY